MTALAAFFKQRRIDLGLGLNELASQVGYRDAGKGAGRIHRFEERGDVHSDLLQKLTVALDIAPTIVEQLIVEDRRTFFYEWAAWANQPIHPYVVVRLLPAGYISEAVPDDVNTTDEAEAFAASRANHWQRRCCLVLNRRHSVWLDEAGNVYDRTEAVPGEWNTPHMRIGRRKSPFLLRSISAKDMIQELDWPKRVGLTNRKKIEWD